MTSTVGSEFTVMKQAVELIPSFRYTIRMFGVPLEGPDNVYCDNETVYKNVAMPSSLLSKKIHTISYQRSQWRLLGLQRKIQKRI